MAINWSVFDGILGFVLLAVVVWAAFKPVTRLLLALVVVVVIAGLFYALHANELRGPGPAAALHAQTLS